VLDRPGLAPIEVDFELEKGIILRGRLTEKGTGKPVRGQVLYTPTIDNPHRKDYAAFGQNLFAATSRVRVAADGSFAVTTIPGPGVLNVSADDTDRYVRKIPEGLKTGGLIREYYHTMVPVNVSPKDQKTLTKNITLEVGRIVSGQVVGPDGKP